MVDNIMSRESFRTFLPKVKPALGDVHIFFEEKANLSLEQVLHLKSAGVNVIQPGIESLSTRVLKSIDKGVTARKNIELLRFARAADLALNWNHLIGFPGDRSKDDWAVDDLKSVKPKARGPSTGAKVGIGAAIGGGGLFVLILILSYLS